MKTRFIISDHHLGHDNIYTFRNDDGSLTRPWAGNAAQGDAMMIEAHNSVVREQDTVYFLGDVAIKSRALALLSRMNGRKILIRGNHDIFRLRQYAEHFADIRGSHKIDRLIMSHYPLHPASIPEWCDANVHGHTHGRDMTREDHAGPPRPDPRYINACVESLGITPVALEEIAARAARTRPG